MVAFPSLPFYLSKLLSFFQLKYHFSQEAVRLSSLFGLLCAPTVSHILGNYCILLTTISFWVTPPCSWKAKPLSLGPWRLKVLEKFRGVLLNWPIHIVGVPLFRRDCWVGAKPEGERPGPLETDPELGSREWGRR